MDLDFLLTTFIYLVIIVSTHFYLKKYDVLPQEETSSEPVFNNELTELTELPQVTQNIENDVKDTIDFDTAPDNNLIIQQSEIDNINGNLSTDEFVKYLDLEDYDKTNTYQSLVKPLKKETPNNTLETSNLDKFFKNIKENNGEFVFEPVPTNDKTDYNAKGLLTDIKKLNDDNVYDNVYAFDDFNSSYAAI